MGLNLHRNLKIIRLKKRPKSLEPDKTKFEVLLNKYIAWVKKHLPCFLISSDKNSCGALLSKMAVNWICMLRKKEYVKEWYKTH